MKGIKDWYNKVQQEKERTDIEVSINGILSVSNRLPYHKQVEVVERIKASLKERERELQDEIVEVQTCIRKL